MKIMRARVFPTVGDELRLLNVCDKRGVEFEIGGDPNCDIVMGSIQRPSAKSYDWFTAYLTGSYGSIMGVCCEFTSEWRD